MFIFISANVFTKDIQQELSKISEFDASWPNTEHVYVYIFE